MKALVAITCIAVLAAVGYYFWAEYSDAKAQAAFRERQSIVRGCEQIARNIPGGSAARACRESGYID